MNTDTEQAYRAYLNQNPSGLQYNPAKLLSEHGGYILNGVWQPPVSVMFKQGGCFLDGVYQPPLNLIPPQKTW